MKTICLSLHCSWGYENMLYCICSYGSPHEVTCFWDSKQCYNVGVSYL